LNTKGKRVIAHFQPQAWINDHAVDIDGAYEFDVTNLIVGLGEKVALGISDCDYGADGLWAIWVGDHPDKDHYGPFAVTVEAAIKEFFAD
jgi:hypothetical protein